MLGLLSAVVVGAAHFLLVDESKATLAYEDFAKITPGMGLSDVQTILGPPRAIRNYGWATFYLYRGGKSETDSSKVQCALVKFNPGGKVEDVSTGEEDPSTLLDRVRSWITKWIH